GGLALVIGVVLRPLLHLLLVELLRARLAVIPALRLGIGRRRGRLAGRHAVIIGLPESLVAGALRLRATSDRARECARACADGGAATPARYGPDAGAEQGTAERAAGRVVVGLSLCVIGVLRGPLPAGRVVVCCLRHRARRGQHGQNPARNPCDNTLHQVPP